MRKGLAAAAVALAGLSAAGPAGAALHTAGFVSPTRLIRCEQFGSSLRCDQGNATTPIPKRPKSCPFDYGFSFGVSRTGRAHRLCVSDAVEPGRAVLRYGRTWSRHGVRCSISRRGLKCRNTSGHGFFTSTSRQYLF